MIRLQELELVFGQTHERTDERTNGWTDRRDVGNSILDFDSFCKIDGFENIFLKIDGFHGTHPTHANGVPIQHWRSAVGRVL